MYVDRRRKRSSFRELSLHYWLSAVAERSKAMALVLADRAGLLVASSVRGPEAEELAAAVAAMATDNDHDTAASRWPGVPMSIGHLDISGIRLLLCAVGTEDDCAAALGHAASGIRRILLASRFRFNAAC